MVDGHRSGSLIRIRMARGEAPSMRAASIYSAGRFRRPREIDQEREAAPGPEFSGHDRIGHDLRVAEPVLIIVCEAEGCQDHDEHARRRLIQPSPCGGHRHGRDREGNEEYGAEKIGSADVRIQQQRQPETGEGRNARDRRPAISNYWPERGETARVRATSCSSPVPTKVRSGEIPSHSWKDRTIVSMMG